MINALASKIIRKNFNPNYHIPEVILMRYCENDVASEHLSRYMFASNFAYGVALDVATGTCYGSSILKSTSGVKMVLSRLTRESY